MRKHGSQHSLTCSQSPCRGRNQTTAGSEAHITPPLSARRVPEGGTSTYTRGCSPQTQPEAGSLDTANPTSQMSLSARACVCVRGGRGAARPPTTQFFPSSRSPREAWRCPAVSPRTKYSRLPQAQATRRGASSPGAPASWTAVAAAARCLLALGHQIILALAEGTDDGN